MQRVYLPNYATCLLIMQGARNSRRSERVKSATSAGYRAHASPSEESLRSITDALASHGRAGAIRDAAKAANIGEGSLRIPDALTSHWPRARNSRRCERLHYRPAAAGQIDASRSVAGINITINNGTIGQHHASSAPCVISGISIIIIINAPRMTCNHDVINGLASQKG